MNYISLEFLILAVITLGIYNIMSMKYRWYVLLLTSLLFYMSFDLKYIVFLAVVSLSTFICARFFLNDKHKKLFLILCVAFNVSIWFTIKYLPWVSQCTNILANYIGIPYDYVFPRLIVPVGISYYVLQAIGYLTDVYRQKIVAEKNYAKYLLFLTWFPAIVQGPISRYDQLHRQLFSGKKVNFDVFRKSMILILFGLVKKMVIADNLAIFSDYCFDNYYELKGIILYIGVLSYSFQLYTDFSGCVDICRGVSGLFGIDLIDNFNGPYFAVSIKEFWRRWHISLSTWLRDYVYIPLGGSYKGVYRKYVNLFLTFLVSGIWHGEGLNFLLWGGDTCCLPNCWRMYL